MLESSRLLFVTICALVLLGTPVWAQDVGGTARGFDLAAYPRFTGSRNDFSRFF